MTPNKYIPNNSNWFQNTLDSNSVSTQSPPPPNEWSKYKEYEKKLNINDFETYIDLSFYKQNFTKLNVIVRVVLERLICTYNNLNKNNAILKHKTDTTSNISRVSTKTL